MLLKSKLIGFCVCCFKIFNDIGVALKLLYIGGHLGDENIVKSEFSISWEKLDSRSSYYVLTKYSI